MEQGLHFKSVLQFYDKKIVSHKPYSPGQIKNDIADCFVLDDDRFGACIAKG